MTNSVINSTSPVLWLLIVAVLALAYSAGIIKGWMMGIVGIALLAMILRNEPTIVSQFKDLRNI